MNTHPIETGRHSGRRGQFRRLLRAANSNMRHKTGLRPGPFDASPLKDEGGHTTSTLITGLLVIYPLLASAGVVLAGFLLLPHGPA